MRRAALSAVAVLSLASTAALAEEAAPPPTQPAPAAAQPAPAAPPAPLPQAPAAARLLELKPYGFIHAAYYRNLRGFSAKDYPGQASSDNGADLMSVRATRVGVKLALTEPVWGAKVTGAVEADFKGGNTPTSFATTTSTTTTCTGDACTSKSTSTTTGSAASTAWTSPLFRIRVATVKATWATGVGAVSVLAGQDATLLAPLAPATLAYGADQLFTQAGNLNRRSPQLRVALETPGALGASAAAAIASSTDSATPVDSGNGNRARRPDLEGRLAGFYRPGGKPLVELGVSGHQNTRRYAVSTELSRDVNEWAGAADLVVSLPYLTLQGEGFAGRAIDDTYAGIAPAVNTASGYGAVFTSGAWAQAVVRPTPLLDVTFGYGVERPKVSELAGVAARTRNTMYGGGLVVNAHKAWKLGAEAYDTVSYAQDAKGVRTRLEAVQLAFSTRLDF